MLVRTRALSSASALPVVSGNRTNSPIAAGMSCEQTARSAVSIPVRKAKGASNNRKNRPYIVRSPDYCAPFPEYRVKVTPRPAFQLFGRGGRILDRQVAAQDHALRDRLAFGVGDRKSVVVGKRVSVRVDPGGRRTIMKNT